MKNLYRIALIFFLILAAFWVIGYVNLTRSEVKVDPVDLNHIEVYAEWYLQDPEFGDTMPEGDYILFDTSGTAVFVSGDPKAASVITSPTEALKAGYPIKAVSVGEKYLGCLVLTSNQQTKLQETRNKILWIMTAMVLFSGFMMVMFLMIIRRRIVVPFRKMEAFAGRVAAGDLSVPLEMNRDDLFGAYSQSFDLMREELAASQKREEELKKRERELIASLSHDLKTPITGIKLICELLSVKLQDADTLEKIHRIEDRAGQMELLISDLLTSSMEDLKELKVSGTDVESRELSKILRKHDDLKRVKEQPVPECLLRIDPVRMDQVIGNILSNSFKYANTAVEVEYTIIDDYLEMKIRDFGPGVSEEELPNLTDRFFRGESATAENQPGSGLGLYIARNLTERMGGTLLCSNAKPGLLITLLIPLS